jgi:hypothetical protein
MMGADRGFGELGLFFIFSMLQLKTSPFISGMKKWRTAAFVLLKSRRGRLLHIAKDFSIHLVFCHAGRRQASRI